MRQSWECNHFYTRLECTARLAAKVEPSCLYGSLPGHWISAGDSKFGQWTLFSRECRLQQLLPSYMPQAQPAYIAAAAREQLQPPALLDNHDITNTSDRQPEDIGILLIGDSNDRNLVYDLCVAAGQKVTAFTTAMRDLGNQTCNHPDDVVPEYKSSLNCNTCSLPRLRISKESMWALGSSSGDFPFAQSRQGGSRERIDAALELFAGEARRPPDLVVVASHFWEISRLVEWRATELGEQAFAQHLARYAAEADSDMAYLAMRGRVEGFLVAWRGAHYPARADCGQSGASAHPNLGARMHVTYYNAAAREAAARHGVHLVDVEAMTAKFWSPYEYLVDLIHLKPELNWHLINVYLNILRNRKRPAQQASKTDCCRRFPAEA